MESTPNPTTQTTPLEFITVIPQQRGDQTTTPSKNHSIHIDEAGAAAPSGLAARVLALYTRFRAYKNERLQGLRPWSEFFDRNKFSVPSKLEGVTRANRNLRHFYSNYLVVSCGVAVYVAISNLNFILSMLLCAALFWYFKTATASGESIVLRGTEITSPKAYTALSVLTLLMFYVTGGSSTIFWLVVGCGGVVLTHAAMREAPPDDLAGPTVSLPVELLV